MRELSFRSSLLLDFDFDLDSPSPRELEELLRTLLEECEGLGGLPMERVETVLMLEDEGRCIDGGGGRELLLDLDLVEVGR